MVMFRVNEDLDQKIGFLNLVIHLISPTNFPDMHGIPQRGQTHGPRQEAGRTSVLRN